MDTGGWKYDRCSWPDPSKEYGQHFLLTKLARDIRPNVLWDMSEEAAYATFCAFRWSANDGNAFCPKCGDLEPYAVRRRRFRCSDAACMREFSVTSGTVFHSRKLSFKKLIMALWEEVKAVKGMSALHLTRSLQIEYKTALVLFLKLRQAVSFRRERMLLWGSVQIDGKYALGHIKPENKKEDRIDRRRKQNQNGKRRCALSVREHNPGAPNRTFTVVVSEENAPAAWALSRDHVAQGAVIIADEHSSYDDLKGLAVLRRVNHSQAYEAEDGTNTNAIESFFARVERSYVGIHHRFSTKYLDWYVATLAWKEDTRYMGPRWQLADLLRTVTHRPVSKDLKGYWQGAAQRIEDQIWDPNAPWEPTKYLR